LAQTRSVRARQLLRDGKAAVHIRYPFTIILKRAVAVEDVDNLQLRLKINPGSRTTGIAIVNDTSGGMEFASELQHRGHRIKMDLESRRALRRSRKTRYRAPRFFNRTRPKGCLAPSLMSRVCNIEIWGRRLRRNCPITAMSMELVFECQKMEHPEISGTEYRQGELLGYEV